MLVGLVASAVSEEPLLLITCRRSPLHDLPAVPTTLNVGIAADDENTDTDTDTADQLDFFSPRSVRNINPWQASVLNTKTSLVRLILMYLYHIRCHTT